MNPPSKKVWVNAQGKKQTAWVISYIDPATGKRTRPQFDTFARADDERKRIERELDAGVHVTTSASITVAEACAAYLAWCQGKEAGLEQNTRNSYVSLINNHIVPHIGSRKLTQLTVPVIEAFKTDLLEKHDLTIDRAKRVIVQLRCVLNRAIKDAKVGHNAAREVTVKKAKLVGDPDDEICLKVLPVEKIRQLLSIARGDYVLPADASDEQRQAYESLKAYPDLYPMLVIGANCGLRSSELRGLRWKDVDLEKALIKIRQSTDVNNLPGNLKTEAAWREIPISPSVVADLRAWRLRCPQGFTTVRIKRGGGNNCFIERTFDQNPLGLVFPNNLGRSKHKAISGSNLRERRWIPLLIVAGEATKTDRVETDGTPIYDLDWGLHDLRHFFASRLIADGVNPKRTTSWLGHADYAFTVRIYGKLFDDAKGDQEIATGVSGVLYS